MARCRCDVMRRFASSSMPLEDKFSLRTPHMGQIISRACHLISQAGWNICILLYFTLLYLPVV